MLLLFNYSCENKVYTLSYFILQIMRGGRPFRRGRGGPPMRGGMMRGGMMGFKPSPPYVPITC